MSRDDSVVWGVDRAPSPPPECQTEAEQIAFAFGWWKALETQRKPLTDEEIWTFWWSRPEVPEGEDDSMEAEFVAAVRRILAAHGIKGDA